MKYEYLIKWLRSPIPGRRRKALEKLTKSLLKDQSRLKEVYSRIKELLSDEDWSVRSVAIKSLTEIALTREEFLKDAVEALKLGLRDEAPNVRASTVYNLARLITKYESLLQNTELISLAIDLLKDENNNVKEASLRLLQEISKVNSELLQEKIEELYSLAAHENANIRRNILAIFTEHLQNFSDDNIAKIMEIYYERIKDPNFLVRENAIRGLMRLLELNKLNVNDDLVRELRKRLRDPQVPVKRAALNLLRKILDKNAFYADKFFDIIAEDLLLKEKNLNLKIEVLKLLHDYVEKVPRDILNKYQIPRALDKLEKATVEKSPKKTLIRMLAREILENKLGYTLELRKKKFGEPDQKIK